jgi:hypothetical protein
MPQAKKGTRSQQDKRPKMLKLPATPPLPEEFAGGKYANHVTVGYTQFEFYLDFWRVDANVGEQGVRMSFVDRMIISPHNVKGLVEALSQMCSSFEESWKLELPNMRGAEI